VGRVDPDGGITEVSLPSVAAPVEITTGADGNLWISMFPDQVMRLTLAGVGTPFDISVPDAGPLWPSVLHAGPDGNVWLASANLPVITRITPAGVVTHYSVSGRSFAVTVGPDGAVWFTMSKKLGRITFSPDPVITEFDVPGMVAAEIVPGPDCTSLYVADATNDRVRRFTPPLADAGADAALSFVDYPVPTSAADVESLALDPKGAVWFVEIQSKKVGFVRP
jgi:virginiamycin B lyase